MVAAASSVASSVASATASKTSWASDGLPAGGAGAERVGGGGGIGDVDDAAASALAFNLFAEPRGDGFIGEIFATARFSACFELAPGTTNVWPPTMASRIVVADTLVVVSTNDFTKVST